MMRFVTMTWLDGVPHVGEVNEELGACCHVFTNSTAAVKFYVKWFVGDLPSLRRSELADGREFLRFTWSLPPGVRVLVQQSRFQDAVTGSLVEVLIPFRNTPAMVVLACGGSAWTPKDGRDCPRAYWFASVQDAREFAGIHAPYTARVSPLVLSTQRDAAAFLDRLPDGCDLDCPSQEALRLPVQRERRWSLSQDELRPMVERP